MDKDSVKIIKQNIQWHTTEAYYYNATHPEDFNIFEQRRLKKLMKTITDGIKGNKPILDLASGTGNLAKYLQRHKEVIACDLSVEMLAENPVSTENKRVCDVTNLPFEDGYFSAVVSYSVFHHFPDPEAVLREVIRVCANRSIIYMDHDFDLLKRERMIGKYGFTWLDVFGWVLWLLQNPKHLKRLCEYFLWGRKYHLKNIATIDKAEDPLRVNKANFRSILQDAGYEIREVRYGGGVYIKASRGYNA